MRRSLRRLFVVGIMAVGLPLCIMTTTASAVTPAHIATTSQSANSCIIANDGQWYFTQIGTSNYLAIRYINSYTGVDIEYIKNSGSTILADFSYYDYSHGITENDQGDFYESAGQTRSFAWNGTYPGTVQGYMWVSGQTTYSTPTICIP